MEFQPGTKSTSWTALGNAGTRPEQNSTTVLQLPHHIQDLQLVWRIQR